MKNINKEIKKYTYKKIIYVICFQLLLLALFVLINKSMWFEYLLIILISIIGSIVIINNLSKIRIDETHKQYKSLKNTMLIANKTLPYLRQGLNKETAIIIAKIIKSISEVKAVAITDKENILAFIGTGYEKHPVGKSIVTEATRNVIKSGKMKIVNSKKEFNSKINNYDYPLESAVIVPLFNKDKVIGSLKLYETEEGKISKETVKLVVGISQLLNLQIELAELDLQTQLATKAKLDALQAQVNPHFLFNALNTINMYIINNPEYARNLIVSLSTLLRYMLGNYGRFITIGKELQCIEDYVVIEKARFNDKLRIICDIDKTARDVQIPVLTIQPLVQNAITHGILPKESGGTIKISAYKHDDEIVISVIDDGVGITQEIINKIYEPGFGTGCGVGIPNVDERLKIIYGEKYGLRIESDMNKGTKAWFSIPLVYK